MELVLHENGGIIYNSLIRYIWETILEYIILEIIKFNCDNFIQIQGDYIIYR